MSENQYHCFWFQPIGAGHKYEATSDFSRVEQLIKQEAAFNSDRSEDWGNVRNLKVIWGTLLEFEAVEVATKYRVKE